VLDIGPAAFRNGGHIEAIARSDERRFVFGEAVKSALAVETGPIIGAAVLPLRFLHARRRRDIEKAISHDGPRETADWLCTCVVSSPEYNACRQ